MSSSHHMLASVYVFIYFDWCLSHTQEHFIYTTAASIMEGGNRVVPRGKALNLLQVAKRPSRIQPERKSTRAGFTLKATKSLVGDSWVITLC